MIEYKTNDPTFGQSEHWVYNGGKLKRVACGLVMPRDDDPQAVVLILAEKFQSASAPPEFTALAARVGTWPDIEQELGDFRRLWKFSLLISEPTADEDENEFLKHVPGLKYASDTIPLSIVATPKQSLTESARQMVDALISTRRLNVEAVKAALDQAASQSARALQCLTGWLLAHPAYYEKPYTRELPPSSMCY